MCAMSFNMTDSLLNIFNGYNIENQIVVFRVPVLFISFFKFWNDGTGSFITIYLYTIVFQLRP